YIKRLEKLEGIANSFEGVEKSFAIQAGREIRIIVKPEEIDDARAQIIARDIAKRIEGELQYPGQIKVTVIRETRIVEFAKWNRSGRGRPEEAALFHCSSAAISRRKRVAPALAGW